MQVRKPSHIDLSPEDLGRALKESDHPGLLRELVNVSRRAFGVHTRHYPHTINYPWTASRLARLAPGARVLDIGAGVSPLPVFLAHKNMFVDCVDNSDIARTLPAGDDWNEWGFFDYGTLHPGLAAHNVSIDAFEPAHRYEAIYSVGAIALLPSSTRAAVFKLCRAWLEPGGILVLANDLIPGTDSLWNLGGSGETPEQHGTYQNMERELTALGFLITESRTVRDVWKSRTDLHLLTARL